MKPYRILLCDCPSCDRSKRFDRVLIAGLAIVIFVVLSMVYLIMGSPKLF